MSIVTIDNDVRYQGWVENVKHLKKSKTNIDRLINRQLKLSRLLPSGEIHPVDLEVISNLSKSAFLIYSSYTEANLLRLIHLPNAFTSNEVTCILHKKKSNIIDAWFEAIKIALSKNNVTLVGNITHANCLTSLKSIKKNYLKDPSEIRNKLIHGQWTIAYNSKYTSKNSDVTDKISSIDIAQINAWYKVFDKFSELLKQLIQSPNKGFSVQYSQIINEINSISRDTQTWNIYSKRVNLMKKGNIPEDTVIKRLKSEKDSNNDLAK